MDENKKINTDDLLKQLEESKKLQDEYLAGWQRQKADFLNYQKDTLKQTQEIVKYANDNLKSLEDYVFRVYGLSLDEFVKSGKKLP